MQPKHKTDDEMISLFKCTKTVVANKAELKCQPESAASEYLWEYIFHPRPPSLSQYL